MDKGRPRIQTACVFALRPHNRVVSVDRGSLAEPGIRLGIRGHQLRFLEEARLAPVSSRRSSQAVAHTQVSATIKSPAETALAFLNLPPQRS